MRFIGKKRKTFIFEINDNRLVAENEEERRQGHFVKIIPDGEPVPVYLKGLRFPVILYKQVYKNKDGTAGVRYPVTNEGTMTADPVQDSL
jgi:hypothetical protein